MNITQISIQRPSLVVVLFGVLTLLGVIGFASLKYELMPDFNQPVVVIRTGYPGADPGEVEHAVSLVLEEALSNLEGVDYLVTKSFPNASVIIANLKYGTDLGRAMQDAQRYIENVQKDLPAGVLPPVMSKVSPNDLPMMSISARSGWPAKEFYQRLENDFLPQLRQLPGVAEIAVLGGERREIQVRVDPGKLQLYKIPLSQVVEAVTRSGKDWPAGAVDAEGTRHVVRFSGRYESLDDLRRIQVAMPAPGHPVYVEDLATVQDSIEEMQSVSRLNGAPGVGLLLKKQGDANAVSVSKQVREKLQTLEKQYAANELQFVIADDSTDKTIAAVESVVLDLLLAVVLVSLVMLLFLGSIRNAFIVLLAIPTSLITAFSAMWLLGYTLNLMTLLAMSLIIGILVDDATVILENIQKHLDRGKTPRQAALDGRMEIGFSALSITLVDVVVFLPILFLQVFVADMLKQFSVVVVISTLTSLLVGFTLTPWLASRFGKVEKRSGDHGFNRFLLWVEHFIENTTNAYGRQLKWVLHHKTALIAGLAFLLVLTAIVQRMGILGKELIATGDQGKFRMTLELDKSSSLQRNDSVTAKVEAHILSHPGVESVFSNVGGPTSGIGSLGIGAPYRTELTIQRKLTKGSYSPSTESLMQSLRTELQERFPGLHISIALLGLVPRSAPVELTLSSSNTGLLSRTAARLKTAIDTIPGADGVRTSTEIGSPEFQLVPNQDVMQRLGISNAWAGAQLRQALTGNDDARFDDADASYRVRVYLDESGRRSEEDISRLPIVNPMGQVSELGQFAEIRHGQVPAVLERRDRQPAITLTAEALGRPSGSVADEVVAHIREHPLPEGVQMHWGSDIKRQNDSFGALGAVLAISFLLIYLILVALYDHYIHPLVVLTAVPLAIIGALLAINLSLSHLSLFALLGLIMLMGLVVKNAILIVDFTNQLRASGVPVIDALVQAGKGRLRPIWMTTLSMVFGMLPIALATGTASEWKNGLAWVIIGGLVSSLLLTVYVVPVTYLLVDKMQEKWRNFIRKPKQSIPS